MDDSLLLNPIQHPERVVDDNYMLRPLGFDFPQAESSSHYGNYAYQSLSHTRSILNSTLQPPEARFETTPSLEHLANFAASESSIHTTFRPETRFSEPANGPHTSQQFGTASLDDFDCWNCSWVASLPPDPFDSVRNGGYIPLSYMRPLLAQNVHKRDGLVLIKPFYMEKWLRLSKKERPVLPKFFDQSLLDARTQTILVPRCNNTSIIELFAVSRSALGVSPVYLYSQFADAGSQQEEFFSWLLQLRSPKFQRLYSPRAEKDVDARIHLILDTMALADFHSSGQLPRNITTGRDLNDISSFRERALIQLTSGSNISRNFIKPPLQDSGIRIGDSALAEDTRSFRYVEFENGVAKKRQKQNREQPSRRCGPQSKTAIAEAREVTKRGGACKRCKKLKKKCDGKDPCDQCKKLDPRKTSKWLEPCVRDNAPAAGEIKTADLEVLGSQEQVQDREGRVAEDANPVEFDQSTRVEYHEVELIRSESLVLSIEDLYDELSVALHADWDEDLMLTGILDEDLHKTDENIERIIERILASDPVVNFDNGVVKLALQFLVQRNDVVVASQLLQNGGALYRRFEEVFQPIHEAINYERIEFVKLFLRHGASITTPNTQGRCPLHRSIERHSVQISKLLMDHIRALSDEDLRTAGWTQLHKAVILGDEVHVRNLLKPESAFDTDGIHTEDSAGWLILKWAAWKGNLSIFQILVEAGADLASGNYIPFAAQYGSRAMVRYLINDDKIPLLAREQFRKSALYHAVNTNATSTKQVQRLIDVGIPINEIYLGRSPLLYAIQAKNASVASLLLRCGADPFLDEGNDLLCTAAMSGLTGVLAMLLKRELPVNNPGNVRWRGQASPLAHAIRAREVESVRMLLKYGADSSLGNEDDLPIHYAAHSGSIAIFKLLLKSRGIDHEAKGNKSQTAKTILLQKKFFCIAKLLGYNGSMDGCECRHCHGLEQDVDLESPYDFCSPLEKLYLAVESGDIDEVRKLVQLGVPVSARISDQNQDTVLHIAVRKDNGEMVSVLLDAGADYQAVVTFKMSPLHEAVCYKRPSIVSSLLAAGASINAEMHQGKTPLIFAAEKGQIDCVQLLLQEEDIDVNIPDDDGWDALSHAMAESNRPLIDLLLSFPGIDIDGSGSKITPVQEAISYGNKEALESLIKAGADPNEKGRYELPLTMAVKFTMAGTRENHDFLETLLASPKINVNAKGSNGRTALIEATRRANYNCFAMLLDHHDVDVNAKDDEGQTALWWAKLDPRFVCELLKHPKIDPNA